MTDLNLNRRNFLGWSAVGLILPSAELIRPKITTVVFGSGRRADPLFHLFGRPVYFCDDGGFIMSCESLDQFIARLQFHGPAHDSPDKWRHLLQCDPQPGAGQ